MSKSFSRHWMQLSLVWTLIALVPVGRVFLFEPVPFQTVFYIIILLLGLLLIPLLILWIDYLQRKKFNWIKIILFQLVIAIIISLAFHYSTAESSTQPRKRTSEIELREMPVGKKVAFFLFTGSSYTIFTSLMLLSGLALLMDYYKRLEQKRNEENELKVNLVMSQIKALQSELQPHFLFNTLHAASSIMEVDVKKAQLLLERLSFLLRNYLDIINRHYYTVEEEIVFLKEFVKVQELRHNGVIDLSFNVSPGCLNMEVPVILLQPIIENSIKHGWINRQKPLQVRITITCAASTIEITVQDNGESIQATQASGIGIRNLKERLAVLYGTAYTFSEQNNNGHFTKIILPVKS